MTPGAVVTNQMTKTWRDLKPQSPVVLVGHRALTREMLEQALTNRIEMMLARGGKTNEVQKSFELGKRKVVSEIVAQFLYQGAFLAEAERRGLMPTSAEVAREWLAVSNMILRAKVSQDSFIRASGFHDVKSFDEKLRENLVMGKLFPVLFGNSLEVKEEEVQKLHRDLEACNRVSAATNKVYLAEMVKLRADLIRRKIRLSEDDEANKKLVPEPYVVEFFNQAPADSFDDEELFTAKMHYHALDVWSDPIEGEDTIDIYYLSKKLVREGTSPTLYTGFRISREKDHGFLVPKVEELRSDLRQRRNIQVVTPVKERLSKEAGVLYPYGFVWQTMFDSENVENKKGSK